MYREENNPFLRPHERQQKSSGMDGRTRLLIVGGAVALVVYLAWPYVRGGMGSIGQQMSGDHAGFPPMFDPLGLLPSRGDSVAEPDRRLRLPPGVGNGSADPYPDRYPERGRADGSADPRYMAPDGDAPARPPAGARRFRECQVTGDRKVCGPWRDLPPVSDRGRR